VEFGASGSVIVRGALSECIQLSALDIRFDLTIPIVVLELFR